MKILVTGASSYVGAKIYDDLKDKFETTGTYFSNKLFEELEKLDITNQEETTDIISKIKPDYIIHIAANANANWCEKNPNEAIKVNQTSTENIVNVANKINAKIIYISSYAVINHKSIYAQTKLASEDVVKTTNSGFVILRPSHIVGYSPNTKNDRQFNRFLRNLFDKVPAIYDTSWKFQPTYLRHISETIQKLIELDINNKIIPIAVPELKSRFDLAKDILNPFGIKVQSEDKQDKSSIFSENLNILKELNLPEYTYPEMIENIIKEIKDNFCAV